MRTARHGSLILRFYAGLGRQASIDRVGRKDSLKLGIGEGLTEDGAMLSAAVTHCSTRLADTPGHFDDERRVHWQDLVRLQQKSVLREVEHRQSMLVRPVA